VLKDLISLRSLNLKFFRSQKIQDKGIESLGEALKNLESLQNLRLNFRYKRNRGRLNLMYSYGKITGSGIRSLAEGLKDRISLQNLNLDFTE